MGEMSPVARRNAAPVALVIGVSVCMLGFAAALAGSPAMPFALYFGPLDPLGATALVVAVAAIAHWFLRAHGGLVFYRAGGGWRGLRVAVILGLAFAVPTVIADIALGFPAGINASLPGAILFYPLMGYVAETAFHLVPLSLLFLLARSVMREPPVRAIIGIAALVEPAFQVLAATGQTTGLDVFVAVHLTVFSVVLLALYRRYDFVTAFAFRLAYYLAWHIVWGEARLQLLF